MSDDLLRYPIGKFERPALPLDSRSREGFIRELERAPAVLRDLVVGVSDAQLDLPYRPGGWTLRQVIHHVPDSHLNAYIRMKLAVTEDTPTITPYNEKRWAELADGQSALIEVSLELLASLHFRWTMFLRGLNDADFGRTYMHPENGVTTIDGALALYAWHGKHHTAHVRNALPVVPEEV